VTARTSIIIPVFRGADMIGDAMASALSQTVACKVIVVDDASGDDTVEAARAAAGDHPDVLIMEQAVNQGPAAARNRAIASAGTEFVALLDADDRMAPGRISALQDLADEKNWDLVADDLLRVSDWDRLDEAARHWSDEDFGEIELSLERFVRENIRSHCGHGRELGYVKPLMRREALVRHDLSYNEAMRLGEDFDLYARALAEGLTFGLVDPLGYHALDRPGSLSKQHASADLKAHWESSRALFRRGDIPEDARAMLKKHMLLMHKKWAWVRLIEAKRQRNPLEALGAFMAPPPVIAELAQRVGEHLRGTHRSGRAQHQRVA